MHSQHKIMTDASCKCIYFFGKELRLQTTVETASEPYDTAIHFFSTRQDCLERLSVRPCDLLIIDLDGCETEGIEVLVQARRMAPWIFSLALVERADVRDAVRAMKAGACDCLEKPVQEEHLLEVIKMQLGQIGASAPHSRRTLTQTEIQVLQMILAGKTSRDIAAELHRSKRTIDVHRKNIMRKFEACGPVDLIKRALGMGFSSRHERDGNSRAKQP